MMGTQLKYHNNISKGTVKNNMKEYEKYLASLFLQNPTLKFYTINQLSPLTKF